MHKSSIFFDNVLGKICLSDIILSDIRLLVVFVRAFLENNVEDDRLMNIIEEILKE
jgi:hypothetical protein